MMRRVCGAIALAGLVQIGYASGEAPPDKSGYNLLRPTPDALLRELATDRPDKTENPYTVDAGHFQLEMDLLGYTYDRMKAGGADRTVRTLDVAPFNVKAGLFNNSDLQLIVETFTVQKTSDHAARTSETISGFGDVTVRWKLNFWGNDGGKTGFGMISFAKFPTSQNGLGNNAVEGGVIFPLEIKLAEDWDLGMMTEVDWRQNSNSAAYHAESINTITVAHRIVGTLEGYVEFFSNVSGERNAAWIGTFDFGATYKFTPNIQLDAGVNIGVTRSADDVNPFVGLTVRY
ncbi:MAG: hypothetical protein QOF24_2130 [Verrucomicrobiota bacterium]|jgi:hypothetical protein